MGDRSNTVLQQQHHHHHHHNTNSNVMNQKLSQTSAVPFLDPAYDFQGGGFGPSANPYGLMDSSGASSGNSAGESQFSYPVRHPSQSEIAGSPASSYAPSVSDGRNNSISYASSSTQFKVPGALPQDRRTSSPATFGSRMPQHAYQNKGYATAATAAAAAGAGGMPGGQGDINTSLWTPNFSFGNPAGADNAAKAQQHYAEQQQQHQQQQQQHQFNSNYQFRQGQAGLSRRGSQGFAVAPDAPAQYNYDRRMSHPVLPSQSFDISGGVGGGTAALGGGGPAQRQRQQSAVDWRSFAAATNHGLRGGHAADFAGSDGLWNTLDSARGMVAMSHQDGTSLSFPL